MGLAELVAPFLESTLLVLYNFAPGLLQGPLSRVEFALHAIELRGGTLELLIRTRERIRKGAQARRHGLSFVDLLDCYEHYEARDLAVDPVHPNPAGHRVAAHAVAEQIGRSALLPNSRYASELLAACGAYRVEEFPQVRGY